MADNRQIRLYETRTVLDQKNPTTGVAEQEFYIVSGSRMLVALHVITADVGVVCNLTVSGRPDNQIPYETLETGSVTGVSSVKRVLSDFWKECKVGVNVIGGNATYKVTVAVYDNASTTRIDNAQIDVDLSDVPDVMGHFDAIRIGDGSGYYLDINEDGSINIRFDNATDETPINLYDESPATPTGSETPVITYAVPAGKIAFLYRVEASGENVARYQVSINDEIIATRRTHHGSGLTTDFEFNTPNKRAIVLQPGDILKVLALHNRPMAGDFEARAQLLLKDAP